MITKFNIARTFLLIQISYNYIHVDKSQTMLALSRIINKMIHVPKSVINNLNIQMYSIIFKKNVFNKLFDLIP